MVSKRIFKDFIKHWIFHCVLLRRVFIFLYKVRGRKPWSLGYSVYKFSFIKEVIDHRLHSFQEKKIPLNYGFQMDERVVEYPWLFSRLKAHADVILDAGSTLNHALILTLPQLKKSKIYIATLAGEGFLYVEPTPSYVYEDLRNMCYKNDFFDTVVCLSTLEHVGMDNTFLYTRDQEKKENDKYAYLQALQELKRVLKKGGALYLSVPYGRYKNHGWLQTFDQEMIQRIVKEFSSEKISQTYFKYENNQWSFSDESACRDGYYFDVHNAYTKDKNSLAAAQCVACLELTK